jgi:serine/threonine protein kinase
VNSRRQTGEHLTHRRFWRLRLSPRPATIAAYPVDPAGRRRPPRERGAVSGGLSAGTLTNAGQFIGTPDYAAPEQINGQPVDGRADQYALGCVAYEVLSGTVPFLREMPMAVLYAHLSTQPSQVTLARPDLPFAVNDVLNTALAKVPGNRYPSCADFADALREALGLDPYDPGVSRLHAKLIPAPDGGWTVADLGTENGITVNGKDVPSGDSVPLRPGDRIHLGA